MKYKNDASGTSGIAAMARDVNDRPQKRLCTSEDEFENYDVFISHRGPDTKTSFVSFLYDGLKYAGLRPFLDRVSIDKGQESWTCIEHAIRKTPIAIVIFSENYAQSEWCLRELHVMMETHGIKVLPVFFKIEPWEVRMPEKGRLSDGMAKLKGRHDATFIDQWRVDLEKASKLIGWEYKEGDQRLENELVSEIVGRIFEWANKTLPLDVGEHAIGVDIVAQRIIQRLDQDKSILLLGLWGMGGIGKSTLARELYNRLRTRFGGSSFVEDVTNKVMQGGIAKVQSRILEDLCNNESSGINDKSRGKVVLEERLCKKKILVVLDDVCENDGMEYLISHKMLSKGSMCIITSRNKRLFQEAISFDTKNEVFVHDVQRLDYEDSRQVFTSFAFGSGLNIDGVFEELVSCISKACGGVPLVLKVCGALLKNEENIGIWKDVLEKLQCGSIMDEKKIFECLRIGYDALQAQQKEMFLDIACALLGESKDMAIQVWRSQGWSAHLGIRSLVEKALVTVDEDGCFGMHDHLRDMGRAIVKREEAREGVTRRIWELESLKLLMDDEAFPKFLETLVINEASKMENICIQLDLSSLKHLRIMRCWLNPMTTLILPKNLKWFDCNQESLRDTTSSCPILECGEAMIYEYKALCESIGLASHFEELVSRRNRRLRWLHDSIGALGSLKILKLVYTPIEGLPESFGGLSSLEYLDLSSYWEVTKLPESFGALGTLRTLILNKSRIECLPESFGGLSSLEYLDLSSCWEVTKLPESFGALGTLRTLILNKSGIECLPESFGGLSSLEYLDLSSCWEVTKLPESFGALGTLRTLILNSPKIESLPESFGMLSSLESLDLSSCTELKKLPDSFGALGNLKTLNLGYSRIVCFLESFGGLSSLESLDLIFCLELKKLRDSIGALGSLKILKLWHSEIACLPKSFGMLSSLERLDLSWCWFLKKPLDSFGALGTLRTLILHDSRIECLPASFGGLKSLEYLDLSSCRDLKKLPESFGALGALRTLNLRESRIEVLPESFGMLSSLESLDMSLCWKLKKLPDSFGALTTLRTLDLKGSRLEGLLESFGSLTHR